MNLLLVEDADFLPGFDADVRVSGRRAEHLRRVLRVVPGQEVRVGRLGASLGTAVVQSVDDEAVVLTCTFLEAPPEPRSVVLVSALPRPLVFRRCVRMATELGVKRMVFVGAVRVEKSYWQSPVLTREAVDEELRLGLEQGRDTILPSVEFCRSIGLFARQELTTTLEGAVVVAHPESTGSLAAVVPSHVVLGPEGGFVPSEVGLLRELGATFVGLGARILRLETAIPAVLGRLFL